MDDTGFYLIEQASTRTGVVSRGLKTLGDSLISALPKVIRVLGAIGTVAMLLVGGGMFVHNIEGIHHAMADMPSVMGELITGLAVGAILLMVMSKVRTLRPATMG